MLPSEYTPLIIGILSPISSNEKFKILFCSSTLQACISEECPLTVIAVIPFVLEQNFMCFLLSFSFIVKSSLNAIKVAGITPSNIKY